MGFRLSFNSISFILLLVALVFLILATITAPVVSSFGLASTNSLRYGVFGYCLTKSSQCSSATYPYKLSNFDKSANWLLASNSRDSLAKVLIVCPIAAGLTFICLVLVLVSHFFSRGMIIFALVFNVLAFLITALICIVVIITFHPHVSWAGWILVGAAVASLLSIPLLAGTLKHRRSEEEEVEENPEDMDLTNFDNNFNHVSGGNLSNPNRDETSSISKDYEFKVKNAPPQRNVASNMSASSVYDSNPQLARDFTMQNKLSGSLGGSQGNRSYYEDARVNLVNGPNTPIQTRQQMAPNIVPNMATPTMNDAPTSSVPQLPYPTASPLNRPPYNPTDMSVFEHHPEVEGHKPFTELPDDGMNQNQRFDEVDSDVGSDFTSVSQRAINPKYRPQHQNEYPPQNYQPQFQGQQPNQQYYPAPQQQQYFPAQNQSYNKGTPPQKRPTISDNVLSNNPDFSLGTGGAKRKQFQGRAPPANRPPMGRAPGSRPNVNRFNQPPPQQFPLQKNRFADQANFKDSRYGMP